MSEKLYSLGDLLKIRTNFIKWCKENKCEDWYRKGSVWTDSFLRYIGELEEENE